MLHHDEVMARRREGVVHAYDAERVMLYALGVGVGDEPLDDQQLRFVTERELTVLPSFATVAVWDIDFKLELGMAWSKLIHAAQRIRLHSPLPAAGEVRATSAFAGAWHKPGRGTLLLDRTQVHDATGTTLLAELEATSLARDFYLDGAPEGGPSRTAALPERPPDLLDECATSRRAALVYRLLGGRSDIHWHPATAREQGFERPIMHGLCTYGHVCHGLLRTLCDYQPERLRGFAARFSAPVYPGETLRTAIWIDGRSVRFESHAVERGVRVLADGEAELAG